MKLKTNRSPATLRPAESSIIGLHSCSLLALKPLMYKPTLATYAMVFLTVSKYGVYTFLDAAVVIVIVVIVIIVVILLVYLDVIILLLSCVFRSYSSPIQSTWP